MAERCNAVVRKRDTYRHTGRGKSGFSMHYQRQQCKRRAEDADLCGQHARIEKRGTFVLRWGRDDG